MTWQDLGTMALAGNEFQVEPAGISFPEGSAKIAVTGTGSGISQFCKIEVVEA